MFFYILFFNRTGFSRGSEPPSKKRKLLDQASVVYFKQKNTGLISQYAFSRDYRTL